MYTDLSNSSKTWRKGNLFCLTLYLQIESTILAKKGKKTPFRFCDYVMQYARVLYIPGSNSSACRTKMRCFAVGLKCSLEFACTDFHSWQIAYIW